MVSHTLLLIATGRTGPPVITDRARRRDPGPAGHILVCDASRPVQKATAVVRQRHAQPAARVTSRDGGPGETREIRRYARLLVHGTMPLN